ncbi:plasmid partitioning protein RepB [Roseibium suaedae]|uniref:Chromosome partitioning protein, ParB family n=1 Tax=Roseibium suaedae TaxID=735517 RepID=A0A1M7P7P8_9HYPH|nr:plasmid partitioning protein RepB [Roseibium suaedae]SHN12703.1 chromosome partitioning protein, ParB family [Roseibium suaedae]
MSKRKDRLKALFNPDPAPEAAAAGVPETVAQPAPEVKTAKPVEARSSEAAIPQQKGRDTVADPANVAAVAKAGQAPAVSSARPVSGMATGMAAGIASAAKSQAAAGAPADTAAPSGAAPSRSASGAIKAMGLSLGQMARRDEPGERIVELDPEKIEPSPIADRLTAESLLDDGFEELKQSLKDHGQQVPVLVRPHPDSAKRAGGWYQTAYGHRRVRAARELGLKIHAQVKPLSDEDLVLAQGQENAGRRDLSFIERAFFAQNLLDAGFDRAMVREALGIQRSELTRLVQVAKWVPKHIALAIGPAPKAGRPRWHALGDMLQLEVARVLAQDEIHSDAFRAADSDRRFQRLYDRLARRLQQKDKPRVIKNRKGVPLAELKGPVLTLGKAVPEAFSSYLADRLPGLLEEFEKDQTD